MSQASPELLPIEVAAREYLACSRSKLYELIRAGEIPAVKFGRSVRIPRRRLLDWIDAQTRGGEAA